MRTRLTGYWKGVKNNATYTGFGISFITPERIRPGDNCFYLGKQAMSATIMPQSFPVLLMLGGALILMAVLAAVMRSKKRTR